MYILVFFLALFSVHLSENTQEQLEAEKFLESLETSDTDPKVKFKNLALKYGFSENKKIHRRTFQKFFVEFEFNKSFEECREVQYKFNLNSPYIKLNSDNKNTAILMNDLDMFMGIIHDSYLSLEKVKKIILKQTFRKFLIDITQKKLKGKKKYLEREALKDLGDNFMNQHIEYDL